MKKYATRKRLRAVAHVTSATPLGDRSPAELRALTAHLGASLNLPRGKARAKAKAELERRKVEGARTREGTVVGNAFCPTGPGGGVDPHCSPGGAPAHKVFLDPRNDPIVVGEAVSRLLGESATFHDLARLTGAPPGSEVEVGVDARGRVACSCKGPAGPDGRPAWDMQTSYTRVEAPAKTSWNPLAPAPKPVLTAHLDGIYVRGTHDGSRTVPPGFGTQVLARQVEALSAAGFRSIEAVGVRSATANGHYTWPRLGFDSALDADDVAPLPHPHHLAARVSDLMRTPEGRAAWREHGQSLTLTFDLAPGSLSRTVLAQYLAARAANAAQTRNVRVNAPAPPPGFRLLDDAEVIDPRTEPLLDAVWGRLPPSVRNAFCPTGKGGGVDPTCSPGRAPKLTPAQTAFAASHPDLKPLVTAHASLPETSPVRRLIDDAVFAVSPYTDGTGHDGANPPAHLDKPHLMRAELAKRHHEYAKAGLLSRDEAGAVERLMESLGARRVGTAGEVVPFDGEFHNSDTGVPTGAPVRVTVPGWTGLYGRADVGHATTGKNWRRAEVVPVD